MDTINFNSVTQQSTLPKACLKITHERCQQDEDDDDVSIAAKQVPLKRRQLMRTNCGVEYDNCRTSQLSMGSGSLAAKDFALSLRSPPPASSPPACPHSPARKIDKPTSVLDADRSEDHIPNRIKIRRFKRRNSKVGRMFYEKDSCTLAYLTSVSVNNDSDLYEEVVKKMQSSVRLNESPWQFFTAYCLSLPFRNYELCFGIHLDDLKLNTVTR